MKSELYLVNLEFRPEGVGAGSMTLQLTVDPERGTLSGRAQGTIRERTFLGPCFSADASGLLYRTGLKRVTKVAGIEGRAKVSVPSPEVGCYLTSFKASFAIDDDWNGVGIFSAGKESYDCRVSRAG